MPTRLIREGILTSKHVAAIVDDAGWMGEVFYRRLHQLADDFGRYTADPTLLRAAMFPLHIDKVREADCTRLLAACEKAGLIRLYAVKGERYLEVLRFDQRTRAKRSRYPAPVDHLPTHDGHMPVTCPSRDRHVRTEAEAEAEAYSEAHTAGAGSPKSSEPQAASEPAATGGASAAAPTPSPRPTTRAPSVLDPSVHSNPVQATETHPKPAHEEKALMLFPVVGSEVDRWPLTRKVVATLERAFAHVDVIAECEKARAWCELNPKRRKTAGGMPRFLQGWIERSCNTGKAVMKSGDDIWEPLPTKEMTEEEIEAAAAMIKSWGLGKGGEAA